MAGGGGRGFVAMGTQPMAAARANGSHAATDAIPLLDEDGAITTTCEKSAQPHPHIGLQNVRMFLPLISNL